MDPTAIGAAVAIARLEFQQTLSPLLRIPEARRVQEELFGRRRYG